ncbi:MAG: hypothetical protein AAFW81_12750 [Pseudomonadota bacterium]
MTKIPEPAKKIQRLMMLGVIIAVIGAMALLAAGCATPSSYAYDGCAEGEKRVRVGPRGQAPDYICRDIK